MPSVQARDSLEHFQVDPASGISSISLGELLDGAVPISQDGGVDSGKAGTSQEKKESELSVHATECHTCRGICIRSCTLVHAPCLVQVCSIRTYTVRTYIHTTYIRTTYIHTYVRM